MNETTVYRRHPVELRLWIDKRLEAALLKYVNDKGLNKNAASRMFLTDRLRQEGYLKPAPTEPEED